MISSHSAVEPPCEFQSKMKKSEDPDQSGRLFFAQFQIGMGGTLLTGWGPVRRSALWLDPGLALEQGLQARVGWGEFGFPCGLWLWIRRHTAFSPLATHKRPADANYPTPAHRRLCVRRLNSWNFPNDARSLFSPVPNFPLPFNPTTKII